MRNIQCILGTGNIGLDIIFQREYPEGFDIAKNRNPFVDKLIAEESETTGSALKFGKLEDCGC